VIRLWSNERGEKKICNHTNDIMSSHVPLPFTLRPNRNAHPGIIDKPQARRPTEDVQAEQAAKEQERLTKVQSRKKTIVETAQVESDVRQAHEDGLKHCHNPPLVAIDRVLRTRPLSESNTPKCEAWFYTVGILTLMVLQLPYSSDSEPESVRVHPRQRRNHQQLR
jgi:hypothetical protein